MAIDRDRSHEISENGLLFEGGAHISSGLNAPSHTASDGDRYYRTADASEWYYLSGSWNQITSSGFDEDKILTDNFFDVLVDNDGNVLRSA